MFSESYRDAEVTSQSYTEYFHIYQTSLTWNAQSYIAPRGGKSTHIELFSLSDPCEWKFFDAETEMSMNFDKVRKDIIRFQNDQDILRRFRACILRGALYVDSRVLRALLTPVPNRCLADLQNVIKDLEQKKVDKLMAIFTNCCRKLRREPQSLAGYVDFCDFIGRSRQLTAPITQELLFVDELFDIYRLLDSHVQPDKVLRPLHTHFHVFKADQTVALNVKEAHSEKFVFILHQQVRQRD
jgi:hypothetical protein